MQHILGKEKDRIDIKQCTSSPTATVPLQQSQRHLKIVVLNILVACVNCNFINTRRSHTDNKDCTEISVHNLQSVDTVLCREQWWWYASLNNVLPSSLFSSQILAAQRIHKHRDHYKNRSLLPPKPERLVLRRYNHTYCLPKITSY